MRVVHRSVPRLVPFAALALTACGLFVALDDYTLGPGAAADAGSEGGVDAEAGPPPPPVPCAGDYGCTQAPPAGWTGPFRLRRSAFEIDAGPPACADGRPPVRLADGPHDTQCSPCACGPAAGASCLVTIQRYDTSDCSGMIAAGYAATNNQCVPNQAGTNGTNSMKYAVGVLDAGACAPDGGRVIPDAPFEMQDDACGPLPGGICPAGQVCAPKPSAAYASACIRHDGVATCPAGWNAASFVVFDRADGRSCAACTCSTPGMVCSGGGATVYCDSNCSSTGNCGNGPSVALDMLACQDTSTFTGPITWSYKGVVPNPVGGCAPSASSPATPLAKTGQATLCCAP